MYRALYRKWRPMTFSDVIGQIGIVKALQHQVATDKIGHAYIFTGTRGTGKTTCAKIFAKAVNCKNGKDGNPCGICDICKGVEDGSLLDVVEIDAASNNGVDNIRELREETVYTPSQSTYKVYIIDEVHMLSTSAFNALLKIMEEPPAHVIFILATTEIHKVPATILSRCQRYDFMRITPSDIAGRLHYIAQQESIELSDEAAVLISRLADGAMRDALSILDTCAGVSSQVDEELVRRMAGVTDEGYLFDISNALTEHDSGLALSLLSGLRERSIDMKRLTEELIGHYRNAMLAGVAPNDSTLATMAEEERKKYFDMAQSCAVKEAVRCIRRFGDALERMAKGFDQRIELELALIDICGQPEQEVAQTPVQRQNVAAPMGIFSQTMPQPMPEIPRNIPTQSTMERTQAPQNIPEGQPTPQEIKKPAENKQKSSKQHYEIPPSGSAEMISFENWNRVVEIIGERDKALHSFLHNSCAYLKGKRILIDAGDTFTDYIRANDYSKELIKEAISETTGYRYGIGPYHKNQGPAEKTALEQLKEMGVEVIDEA